MIVRAVEHILFATNGFSIACLPWEAWVTLQGFISRDLVTRLGLSARDGV